MRYEVVQDKRTVSDWRVEAINDDSDGEVYVSIFSGPLAKERAEEYSNWKNQQWVTTPDLKS